MSEKHNLPKLVKFNFVCGDSIVWFFAVLSSAFDLIFRQETALCRCTVTTITNFAFELIHTQSREP